MKNPVETEPQFLKEFDRAPVKNTRGACYVSVAKDLQRGGAISRGASKPAKSVPVTGFRIARSL
jgi:hypothetical protein